MRSFFEDMLGVLLFGGLFYCGTLYGQKMVVKNLTNSLKDEEIEHLRAKLAALNAKNQKF